METIAIDVDLIEGIFTRMQNSQKIWIPALILVDVSLTTLTDTLESAIYSNWYFDIVSKDQLQSIPIRIGNLLKIHDHLYELKRYDEEISALQKKLQQLEESLDQRS